MPDRWVIVLALVLVAVFVVLALLPREVRLYRRANPRPGVLELDDGLDRRTPAEIAEYKRLVYAQPPPSPLRRCRPSRGVHYHGAGDRCECGKVANVCSTLPGFAVHPLAPRPPRREIRRATVSVLAVCGHPIAAAADYVLDEGYVFCSPACADERNLSALHDSGDAATTSVWEQPCGECGRSPASLRYACEHCPRLTTPAMRREWRELQGFAATGDEAA